MCDPRRSGARPLSGAGAARLQLGLAAENLIDPEDDVTERAEAEGEAAPPNRIACAVTVGGKKREAAVMVRKQAGRPAGRIVSHGPLC